MKVLMFLFVLCYMFKTNKTGENRIACDQHAQIIVRTGRVMELIDQKGQQQGCGGCVKVSDSDAVQP